MVPWACDPTANPSCGRANGEPLSMKKPPLTRSLLGICTFTAFTTLSLLGAGSEKIPTPTTGPQAKQENPAIKAYNEGVDLMQSKQFAKAQAKFEEGVKLNPGLAKAHKTLAFTFGKEEPKI